MAVKKKKRGAKAAKAKKQAKKSSKLAKTDTDLTFNVKDDEKAPRDPSVPAKRAQLASKGRAVIQRARTAEREQRRLHVPVVDQTNVDEPPPLLVAVHSPPGVGKSTLIRCLVKHYTRQSIGELRGPVTVVASKKRRLTFIECPNDLCGMIDVAKSADLVLLMIDGEFGFEMETFEFLMLLQQHGMPKVIGVLNHLDAFSKDSKKLKKVKTDLKHRFEAEVSHGAKLFYLSSIRYGKYLKREVLNLARFISVAKTRPLTWRTTHPYFIADRFEDITHKEQVRQNPKCDRSVVLFGYLRGCNLRNGQKVHIAGVDDFTVSQVDQFPDPCPLPHMLKKRTLNEQERQIYAPMSDVGGLLYDKDATYIDIPDWKRQHTKQEGEGPQQLEEGEAMIRDLQDTKDAVDARIGTSAVQLFSKGGAVAGGDEEEEEDDDDNTDNEEESEEEGSEDGNSEQDPDSEEEEEEEEAPQRQGTARPAGSRRRAPAAAAAYQQESDDGGDNQDSESDDDDELFQVKGSTQAAQAAPSAAGAAHDRSRAAGGGIDALDSPYFDLDRPEAALERWQRGAAAAVQELKHRIVTGGEAAFNDAYLRSIHDGVGEHEAQEEEDEEVYGDFEDVELGHVFSGSSDPATKAAMKAIKDEAQQEQLEAKREASKVAKKAAFDNKYDSGGARAVDKTGGESEDEGGNADGDAAANGTTKGKKKGKGWALGKEEETYFDHLKKEIAERQALTRAELDSMDQHTRQGLEGFRVGSYIRIRLTDAPCELVECFKPSNPVLVGGLGQGEDKVGFMHLRMKRHRWFPKLLKNLDPLVLSAGWRRYQTLPVLSQEDNNGRHRMLKYTPEHMHCRATVFGPLVPPQTGIIAVQNLASSLSSWRISATAVVMELDARFDIMKKLKLVGHPYKIERHTAYIKDMFTSEVEVSKFVGAAIQTTSGIRGTVKKSVQPTAQNATPGSFRATFEDKLVQSDLVMLKAWVAVRVPRFWNPVTNLLAQGSEITRSQKQRAARKNSDADAVTGEGVAAIDNASAVENAIEAANAVVEQPDQPGGSTGWVGARTVAQMRRGMGVGAPREVDSLYKPVSRVERVFPALKVPKNLQKALPFATKPKVEAPRKRQTLEQRRAVPMEKNEKKAHTLLQQLNTIRNGKASKRREQKRKSNEVRMKKKAQEDQWRQQLSKEERKRRYMQQAAQEQRNAKKRRHET